jgi:hypothetical protein
MATTNPITGDLLVSKTLSETGEKNYEAIFGANKKKTNGGWTPPPLPLNEYPETSWDDGEQRIENIGRNSNEGLHYKK